jgi:hypothetical protein
MAKRSDSVSDPDPAWPYSLDPLPDSRESIALLQMRAELAVGYCKYMNLREEAGSLLPRYHLDTQCV